MRLPLTETLKLVEFRAARPADIDGLVELFRLFFADSDLPNYGLSFDPVRMRAWTSHAICGGRYPHIIATDNETRKIIGSIAYHVSQDYTDRPVAEMDKFYVLLEWRRSAIGRTLLTLAIDAAQSDGAAVFRVFVNSGIPGSVNIFRKFGFRETPHSLLLGKEL